jgi:hypothetical protein
MNFPPYQCKELKGEEEIHYIPKENSSAFEFESGNSKKFHDAEINQQYLVLFNRIENFCLNLIKCNKIEKVTVEDKLKKQLFYYLNQINLKIILNTEGRI